MLPKPGILIKSHQHDLGFKTRPHQHKNPSLIYIVSGRGTCRLPDQELRVQADTVLLLPAATRHQLLDEPRYPMTVFVVYFDDRLGEDILSLWSQAAAAVTILRPTPYLAPELRRGLREMLYEQTTRGPHYRLALRILFGEMVVKIARQTDRQPHTALQSTIPPSTQRVQSVIDYIAANYYKPLSLAQAARLAHLSQRRFSTLFRKLTGESFLEHLQHIRAERAAHLLKTTNRSIAAIAFEVGFEDLSTFYRTFNRRFALPPAQLRKAST